LDPSTAPWRAFETPEPGAAGRPAPPANRSRDAASVPRWALIAGVAAVLLLVLAAVTIAAGPGGPADIVVDAAGTDASEGPVTEVVVDVGGAVAHPGVYHLPSGARVADAIAAAGGFGPRVDAARAGAELNLAAALVDGEHLVVPSRDDLAQGPAPSGGPVSTAGTGSPAGAGPGAQGSLVDLNHATADELDTLPGIGPATAAKIIAARAATPFTSVQDLRDRKLVGQKTFDGLRDLVTVR
jgi:competence protein ComEA